MRYSKVMMGKRISIPPHNETETRRVRAYLMLVIDVLTLSASAIALMPSASRLGPSYPPDRLQEQGHDENDSKI